MRAIEAMGGLACQIDLAYRWELSKQRVHELVREPTFPAPVAIVAGRWVWLGAEADAWLEDWRERRQWRH